MWKGSEIPLLDPSFIRSDQEYLPETVGSLEKDVDLPKKIISIIKNRARQYPTKSLKGTELLKLASTTKSLVSASIPKTHKIGLE